MNFLHDWPTERLETLYRVAKSTGFFNCPHCMIYLRSLLKDRRTNSYKVAAE